MRRVRPANRNSLMLNRMDEYLTITEVAQRLKLKPKTVRNKMNAGVFTEGVHYFRRKGIGTRFKWGAVVAWLEQKEATASEGDSIPMARGYRLGEPRKRNKLAA
jgi:helix-turn-helix protein